MRNLSLLLVAALGLLAVGCKPNGVNPSPFPQFGQNNSNLNNNQNNPPLNLNTNNNVPNNPNFNNNIPNNNNYNPTPMPQPNSGGGGLAGTYHINTEHFNMQLHGQTPPQEQLEQMVQQLKQALGQVQLTLNADGTYSCSGSGQTSTGHYSVNGNTLMFQEDQPSGQPLPQITIQGGQLMLHIDTQAASMDLELVR